MIVPKKSIQGMKPYFSNSQKFRLKLDANEGKNYLLDNISLDSIFKTILSKEELNIYPDSDAVDLKSNLATYYGVKSENLILGNGSSEMIHLLLSTYCEKNDTILTFSPNFSMYDIYSRICDAKLEKIDTYPDFVQNIDMIINKGKKIKSRIILLCNPNNPTGATIPIVDIEKVVIEFPQTIIAIDEAYADFSKLTAIELVKKYKNVVVLRTLSKAFGLADLRIGLIIADKEIILQLQCTKSPYNLNGISQKLALYALKNKVRIPEYISEVNKERTLLYDFIINLSEKYELKEKLKPYPSNTNFIFIKSESLNLAEKLLEKSIAIRDFSKEIPNHYRISIGAKEENELLKLELNNIFKEI